MGTWGVKLYDNDCASDVRDCFLDALQSGATPNEAATCVYGELAEIFLDSEDGPIASAALADLLWHRGCLDTKRKEQVLAWLNAGGDLERWRLESPTQAVAREKILCQLRKQLSSPMPSQQKNKKVCTRRKKQLDWQSHQLYALPLVSEEANTLGLDGEYLLFYVLGESSIYQGYRNPLIWVKITQNRTLPKDVADFNKLEFIQISCTPYENRFRPFQQEADLPPEYRQSYQPDVWGYLPEYTMEIMQSTGNHPPANLISLGIFDNVQAPPYEFHRYCSALGCAWKYAEEYILLRYKLHNLHQAQIYKK